MNLTSTWIGILGLAVFGVAYACVIAEDKLRLRKSTPVMIAAGLIWILIGVAYTRAGIGQKAEEAIRHNLLEYGELFLFLLSAITYVNTMEERQVFDAMRSWLIRRGFGLRALFWITGGLAFVISPIADNLTTTLVMGTVAIAVGGSNTRFVTVACINVVVAANAGGAFSPFGDITTLMVWQKGHVSFTGFFALFLPAVVNWLIPAFIMSFSVEKETTGTVCEQTCLKPGALIVVALFLATITLTVYLHSKLHLPAALGMMSGLGLLKLYSFMLTRAAEKDLRDHDHEVLAGFAYQRDEQDSFDIFRILERVEWDTLMFFYGVILCVGGLGSMGYLALVSHAFYGGLSPTIANSLVGVLSALVDNIPVMYAVLSMNPTMSHSQWLLVTLTAGVGGSLLSIGSAAGVALMGQARGIYTFMSHLRWTWAVALGYLASVGTHLLLNGR